MAKYAFPLQVYLLSLFKNMSNFMKKPNIIVHLDVTPEESLRRITMRSRGCETGVTLEYLQGLHAAYEDFIVDIARVIPVIKVDYSQFRTADEMAVKIAEQCAFCCLLALSSSCWMVLI